MFEGRNAFPGGVYGDLDQVVRSDLYYHYSTPICAQRWLDVCEDPVYGHRDLLQRLNKAIPGLVETLRRERGAGAPVRVISLGPGDGAVDEHLLLGLDEQFAIGSYCGLDFSFDLLRRAAHRLSRSNGLTAEFPMKMICGDFTDLDSRGLLEAEGMGSSIFCLTGFTLGNYSEAALLDSIGSLMKDGDFLLLDARLHSLDSVSDQGTQNLEEKARLSGHYDLETVRRFVFGPVEVATMASADDVGICFEVGRSLTSVPNALNLVIYCSGLETTLRLTGETVRRDRLNLAITTTYNPADLGSWFCSRGFSAVWQENFQDVAFFLLKRS
jgi:hypothetical protein